MERPGLPPLNTTAIRRRVNREYLVLSVSETLDDAAALALVASLDDQPADTDVVLDARSVRRCDAAALQRVARTAAELQTVRSTVTLSHPSDEMASALHELEVQHRSTGESLPFEIRRSPERRPLRRSRRSSLTP